MGISFVISFNQDMFAGFQEIVHAAREETSARIDVYYGTATILCQRRSKPPYDII